MNAISTLRNLSFSSAAPAAPATSPAAAPAALPAAVLTLSPSAQKALSPQPDAGNIPWGSGPSQ